MRTMRAQCRFAACAALRSAACRPASALLALGAVHLAVSLACVGARFETTAWVAFDLVEACFLPALWAALLCGSAALRFRPGRRASLLAAKTAALIAWALAALLAAILLAVAAGWLRGAAIEPAALALRSANAALGLLHLACLAVFAQALVRRPWLGAAAAAAAAIGANAVFEHPLLRYGASAIPWSAMRGGVADASLHAATALYWTGIAAALAAAARLVSRRAAFRVPMLGSRTFALGWAGAVVAVVSGAWVLGRDAPPAAVPAPAQALPQPDYLRLDLDVELHPRDGVARSTGVAVVVNRGRSSIGILELGIPTGAAVHAVELTGDALPAAAGSLRYRLNRPLAPGETLRVAFALQATRGIAANGTFLTTADLAPTLGARGGREGARDFFAAAPPAAFATRISTALEQIAIAPGALEAQWKENGRRFFEYRAAAPISPLASFHSARYDVARGQWRGTPIEIYCHPPHASCAPKLLAAARDYLAARGDAPALPRLRLIEVPDAGRVAHPPLPLLAWRQPERHPRFFDALPFSELAVLSRADARD